MLQGKPNNKKSDQKTRLCQNPLSMGVFLFEIERFLLIDFTNLPCEVLTSIYFEFDFHEKRFFLFRDSKGRSGCDYSTEMAQQSSGKTK